MDASMDASAFEQHRERLFAIAYRMLGSRAEAEDIVQDAYLRRQGAAVDEVQSERAYLSTIVTRLCLDHLKSARTRREQYVGPWLPEPVRTDSPPDAESISLAFLVLLERLTPVQRAVYLLHEVFDYSHAEVAQILARDEVSCRQDLHRAREELRARRPRFAPTREAHARLLEGFARAMTAGDLDGLERLLAVDVESWSDSGGKAQAARRPLFGAHDVARFFVGLAGKATPDVTGEIAEINGWPALLIRRAGSLLAILNIETDGERIYAVRSILNPDKLAGL